MAKYVVVLAKISAAGGLAWLVSRWMLFILPITEIHTVSKIACVVLMGGSYLAAFWAIMLINSKNLGRVCMNVFILFFFTAVGLYFGDPWSRGSYDHGGGETELGMLLYGCLGALFGYAVTLLQELMRAENTKSMSAPETLPAPVVEDRTTSNDS